MHVFISFLALMCVFPSGFGDQECERTSKDHSQDGERGALRGAGAHTVTMETQLNPMTFVRSFEEHPQLQYTRSAATGLMDTGYLFIFYMNKTKNR